MEWGVCEWWVVVIHTEASHRITLPCTATHTHPHAQPHPPVPLWLRDRGSIVPYINITITIALPCTITPTCASPAA